MSEYQSEIEQMKAISMQIIPLLSGQDPNIAGGVLGELCGMYFAGHSPESRDEVRELFNKMVDQVIAILDAKPDGPWKNQW